MTRQEVEEEAEAEGEERDRRKMPQRNKMTDDKVKSYGRKGAL